MGRRKIGAAMVTRDDVFRKRRMGRAAAAPTKHHGERGLPRKPNHSFERRQRELAKAEKKAARPTARSALNRGPTLLEPAILGT